MEVFVRRNQIHVLFFIDSHKLVREQPFQFEMRGYFFFTGQLLQKKYLDLKDVKINNLPCIIHQDFWYNLKRNCNRLSCQKNLICFVCNKAKLGSKKRNDPSTKSQMVTPYTHGRYSHSGGIICLYLIQVEIFLLIVA